MLAPTTRKTLLAKVAVGDAPGWREFYDTYKGMVIAVARRRHSFSEPDLAGIIQNVMCAVYHEGRFAYDLARGIKFRTWFCRIVQNKINDFWREHYSRIKVLQEPTPRSSGDAVGGVAEEPEFPDDPFAAAWDTEWCRHLLVTALAQLRLEVEASTYHAFELVALQEKNVEDAAVTTGMTVPNVYVCKSRCMKKLTGIVRSLEKQEGRSDSPACKILPSPANKKMMASAVYAVPKPVSCLE